MPARRRQGGQGEPGRPLRDHRRRSDASKGDNVAQLTFAENEGSFLVGAAAALKSKTGHIGFVGGVNVPLINKFEAGYVAGAKAVNPDIKIESTYLTQPPDFSGFGDPAKGKTAAEGMFQVAPMSSTTLPVAPVVASSPPPRPPRAGRSVSTPTRR
jgi:hypothetical protein